jgi:hypothetical protein
MEAHADDGRKWVIFDRLGLSASRPLIPKERKYSGHRGTSHLCHERSVEIPAAELLLKIERQSNTKTKIAIR